VFYQDAFRGYTLRLVQKKGNSRKLITLPGEELVENVETIERDIRTLSDKKVLLNGITPDNVLFNGRLYLTDPAHYKLLELYGTEDLERLNGVLIILLKPILNIPDSIVVLNLI
jgi:hypothetical protein